MFISSIVLVLNIALALAGPVNMPSSFPKCRFSQSDYKDCFLNSVQEAFKNLKNGNSALKVLPIDPLEVSEVSMSNMDGPGAISMTMRDMKIYGFSDMKIETAGNNLNKGNLSIWMTAKIPQLRMVSQYNVNGRILILPISGDGGSNITLRDVEMYARLDNKLVTKDGEEYLKNYHFESILSPNKVIIQMDNLFGGNAELGRQMNMILNENAEELFKEISPGMKEAFSQIYKQITNQIFGKVPFKRLFAE